MATAPYVARIGRYLQEPTGVLGSSSSHISGGHRTHSVVVALTNRALRNDSWLLHAWFCQCSCGSAANFAHADYEIFCNIAAMVEVHQDE